MKREKGKETFVVEEKIVNLSLSDSNISNKEKLILREEKMLRKWGRNWD